MMPPAIVGTFTDCGVEFAPIVACDLIVPVVKIAQDRAHAPPRAGVANLWEKRERFLDAGMRFLFRWPIGKLRETRAGGTARRIKIAHHHVIEQDVMESACAEPSTDQMRVDIEHRERGKGGFHEGSLGFRVSRFELEV